MSGTNHQEYQRIIREIDCFFGRMGIGFKEKTRNLCLFFCNQVHCAVQQLLLLYYVIYQPSDPLVKSQQIWATIAMIQVFVKVYNRLLHSKEMEILLEYFEGIYTGTIKEEYQMVLDKHLNAQNRQIKTAFWVCKLIWYAAGFFYTFQPILLQTGALPTPVTWNGVPEQEFSRPIYILLYCGFSYNAYLFVFFCLACDSFFVICVVILGHRLSTIADILKLLNYSGPRDRVKDKRIIVDAHLMHLEVLEKIGQFQSYFNIYGLFHLGSPMLVIAMLLYNLLSGFDMVSAFLSVSFFSQILVVAFFSQLFSGHATGLSESIYLLDWHNLNVEEQRFILLLLMRSQQEVHVSAGSYFKLNFELVTKVVKLEMSFFALVRNFK